MARVLLYNFTDEKRRKEIKRLLFSLAIPVREIRPEEQGVILSEALAAGSGPLPCAEPPEHPFGDEMLLMAELSPRQADAFLNGLKRAGIRVPLKAMATPVNRGWSSLRLHEEISAEHVALSGPRK